MVRGLALRHAHQLRCSITGALGMLLYACHAHDARPHLDPQQVHAALENYAAIALASYEDAADAWTQCQRAIDTLLAKPSSDTLSAAREAWLRSRIPYQQTEAFRFYGGPIDQLEMLINTWPIDETYIESSTAQRGIITDAAHYPDLSAELLVRINAEEGETSISTGYHAIEFLLWGRDQSALGPGARPYTDFVERDGDHVVARRKRYLALASALLGRQLGELRNAWLPGRANYRAHFLALPGSRALASVLKGVGTLSGPELAGERLTVPYETRDPENEQSCFSDSTQQDIVNSALGIENVCAGSYQRQHGPSVTGLGVCALIESGDREVGRALREDIRASVLAAQAIPAPFDRAIEGSDDQPGRKAIANTIRALEAQTALLARIASQLKLTVQQPTEQL